RSWSVFWPRGFEVALAGRRAATGSSDRAWPSSAARAHECGESIQVTQGEHGSRRDRFKFGGSRRRACTAIAALLPTWQYPTSAHPEIGPRRKHWVLWVHIRKPNAAKKIAALICSCAVQGSAEQPRRSHTHSTVIDPSTPGN